ncbi:Bernardinelli-Seip congenital lipodystrophy 2 homolog (human), isoform CRA_d [Rattus norvegicus]|uniref:Bernardinelli-Seip congenital lipodystrophy 2 homolog (Human), isoform CRA_d n=1 Tax=Rattus norvegicus TaxID=10116 RepID=A6HZV6_RAT|nr:Bernardinelli-Seip congenital lipodystrophy 2 homolog (human), isoform CRA_d [Rattus norvegicus]
MARALRIPQEQRVSCLRKRNQRSSL